MVCLIRAERICGQGSLCLHVEGGFGREHSFTGLSGGEDNAEECTSDVLFQNVPSAFLQHSGKTRIMPVEYPIEMDLLRLLVLEKSG